MLVWFDTEFIDDGDAIIPLSIGAVRAETKAKAAARNVGLDPESLVLCGSDGVPLGPTFSPFGPLVLAPTKLSGLLSYSIKTRPMWQFFMAPKAKR